jgi:hypothetical protein
MWKVPEQAGFYTIKAAVFPFKPHQKQDSYGIVKELSLVVSEKSKIMGYFSKEEKELVQWYQFHNNLLDSKNTKSALHSQNQTRWLTHKESYALALGERNVFFMPNESFAFSEDEEGEGTLKFHLLSLSQGTIFNATFNTFDTISLSPSKPLNMKLLIRERNIFLQISSEDALYEALLNLENFNPTEFISVNIKFKISQKYFSATLCIEETETQTIELNLNNLLNGEGSFVLGETSNTTITAMLDEFAVIFNRKSIAITTLKQRSALGEHKVHT